MGTTTYTYHALRDVSRVSGIRETELYVVWFCKTLQNWKALVSTDAVHGRYWEVTHNGDKGETYVDTYVNESNVVTPDDDRNYRARTI